MAYLTLFQGSTIKKLKQSVEPTLVDFGFVCNDNISQKYLWKGGTVFTLMIKVQMF